MCEYLTQHLGSIGLLLDIIGVSILFFIGIPLGDQIGRADPREEADRKKRVSKQNIKLRTGYLFILIGFIAQLISYEIK